MENGQQSKVFAKIIHYQRSVPSVPSVPSVHDFQSIQAVPSICIGCSMKLFRVVPDRNYESGSSRPRVKSA